MSGSSPRIPVCHQLVLSYTSPKHINERGARGREPTELEAKSNLSSKLESMIVMLHAVLAQQNLSEPSKRRAVLGPRNSLHALHTKMVATRKVR